MRKYIPLLAILGILAAGCGERVAKIDGTNKTIVWDADGDVDLNQVANACGGASRIGPIQYIKRRDDARIAIVECR